MRHVPITRQMISASRQIGERCLRGEPHGGHLLPTDASEPTQGCLVTVGDTGAQSILLLDDDCHLGRRLGLRLGWDRDLHLLAAPADLARYLQEVRTFFKDNPGPFFLVNAL